MVAMSTMCDLPNLSNPLGLEYHVRYENLQRRKQHILNPIHQLTTHPPSRGIHLISQRPQDTIEQIRRLHTIPVQATEDQFLIDRLGMHGDAPVLGVVQGRISPWYGAEMASLQFG